MTWDPQQYLAYADERSRPFFDLIGRIAARPDQVLSVVDLGCGPGQLTTQLATRWPCADIVGIDSSPDMITSARTLADAGSVRFEQADLRDWKPAGPLDVIICNATLQWLADHRELLLRFVSWLSPGGWLAFQVPGNFLRPSHRLLAELRTSPRWRDRVGDGADRHLAVADPADYAHDLGGLGCSVDAWETTYIHLLTGDNPVLEWVKGTGLRPVLAALNDEETTLFLSQYADVLNNAYPSDERGVTPFAFRRIFVVAQRQNG